MRKTYLAYLIVAALATLPWVVGGRYVFHVATMITIMIPLALSLNLMLKVGQLSLAQAAFMGIGAYGAVLLTMRLDFPPMLSVFAGGLLAAATAAICGPVFLRIKGVYFALLTFAFGQIVNLVFQEWTSLFGGNSGIYGIPKLSVFGMRFSTTQHYYLFGLVFCAVCYVALRLLERSEIGRIFQALKEDETLSRSLGSNALAWRVAAFVGSALIAGIAGGIYGFYIGFLSPDAFTFWLSVDLIVMNVVGGATSVLGPVLGAIFIVPLPEFLREARAFQLLIYGVVLIIFLVLIKDGLVTLFERRKPG
ncbi:branched-chain amino acid ABC transporter permease [Mesorhizobium sp. LHD-90]|uniref:branched-chain amino acid ABC transporter permease n=1 Tax=Mesorhizobium sp. LHD-90 TaxID=3071414 RepID=UPI0027DF2A8D|nr:branched-chain amino acid ABC transporter permease [Mesorhizobium sp. LHD-90]MDQ6433197.1 branched-chain amino acid ABC transporter permease [Mesorhizobium sp. LHD-90]